MTLDTTVGGASSDSYASVAGFKTYSSSMGWTVTGADADLEPHMRRAAVFLDREYQFLGTKKTSSQARAWPRTVNETDPDGFSIPSDSIPLPIIYAQYELAYLIYEGHDLLEFKSGAEIKREKKKVGPIEKETEYAAGSGSEPRVRAVEGLLRGYIVGGQPGESVRTARLARG
ncbi:hypothetical protein NBRC116590_02790 [Pelagimonas sp. KU-00592-HH]|uniref:DnaT-like ssDNA-binding protein n=1 Tax=Pelagimonas sp. KU-00592-HH TaxID=3127651 RepID=UPI00310B1E91